MRTWETCLGTQSQQCWDLAPGCWLPSLAPTTMTHLTKPPSLPLCCVLSPGRLQQNYEGEHLDRWGHQAGSPHRASLLGPPCFLSRCPSLETLDKAALCCGFGWLSQSGFSHSHTREVACCPGPPPTSPLLSLPFPPQ